VVPVANGGTGSATQNFVDLSNAQMVGGAKTFTGNVTVQGTLSATLSGWEMQTTSNSGASYITATATCSSGKNVIGGGCQWDTANDSSSVFPLRGYPDSPTTYSCAMWNQTGVSRTLTAYVICAYFKP
jgi:hypothetical protein